VLPPLAVGCPGVPEEEAAAAADSGTGDTLLPLGEPPSGPVPACDDVPGWACEGDEAFCGELIPFEPLEGDGWINYPINGETAANQYRSFARRDLVHLLQYATSKVRCLADGWPGNGGQLGLGDMSEDNGDIPGTSIGQPAHPSDTHRDGFDIDVAYYQVDTDDNLLRPVCEHTEGGQDAYRCTAAPTLVDLWRNALLLGVLHDSPQLRVVGVDARLGPTMVEAVEVLCHQGFVSGPACQRTAIVWEDVDEGRGWYRFHHHHQHVSLTTRVGAGFAAPGPLPELARACLVSGCGEVTLVDDPRVRLDYGGAR
jgi:hypothetical protein